MNVSSQVAELGVRNLAAYGASKAGIQGLTRQLAIDLAPLRIRVNAFGPGPVNVRGMGLRWVGVVRGGCG